jgi:hypothetical protein
MSEYQPRLFASCLNIRRIGTGLLSCSLPCAEWTHEAHLAACTWLAMERTDIVPETELPQIIRRYNEAVGGINDDSQGYHETITQTYIITIRQHLASIPAGASLLQAVNSLLQSPRGDRRWPLRFYSNSVLFSVDARHKFVPPDIMPFD